jgi:hypothetical protein
MTRTILAALLTAAVLVSPVGAAAAGDAKKASQIIFESQHLDKVNKGDELVYDFASKATDETLKAADFSDKISVKIMDVVSGKRAVEMQIYTGDRARELQKMPELTINPIFVVSMQQSMATIARMSGGDFNYLKVRFSKVLDEKGKVEPLKIDYKGETHDAFRLSITPFTDDPAVAKMKGYEISTYSMIVSPTVPGEFVESVSVVKSKEAGKFGFEDRTAIAGFGGVK